MTKAIMTALTAAAFIAAATAAVAQSSSAKTQGHAPRISGKHHPGLAHSTTRPAMQAGRTRAGYPNTFGYAPDPSRDRNTDIESSRQAGGGGGGM